MKIGINADEMVDVEYCDGKTLHAFCATGKAIGMCQDNYQRVTDFDKYLHENAELRREVSELRNALNAAILVANKNEEGFNKQLHDYCYWNTETIRKIEKILNERMK